jgi:hypothetical protein
MRTDSCRNCGNELEINQRCNICNDAIEFYCHGCGTTTEKQIHQQCMLIKSGQHMVKVTSKRN